MTQRADLQFVSTLKPQIWLVGISLSVAVHFISFGLISARQKIALREPTPVKVRIVETKKETPPEPKPAAPVPPPALEKPKPKPKPEKKITTERKPVEPPVANAKPIQGLDKNSMAPDGKGVAVPIGNTLMTEDTGERVKEAAPMAATDLSADARLIRESIETPKYTDAAIDANFEGVVVLDVLVDEQGNVQDAELRKKVGYGMDERILAAVRKARFIPRKNKLGGPESGWTELRFPMKIE